MKPTSSFLTVRPELVEGLPFFSRAIRKKRQCFDKLSTNELEGDVSAE